MKSNELILGLDIGSTTIKAIVMDSVSEEILWKGYERHETKQAETLLEFLETIQNKFPIKSGKTRSFITGSGGGVLAPVIGAKFVQEVNAISLAVEKLHPDTGSVIEIGGQDSKMIFWVEDEKTGAKIKQPTMNDKCAGGTGAVIDKIGGKLGLTPEKLRQLTTDALKLHPVAGRCGVFAETDINSLQKQGVPSEELMNSLFEAIVQQNLSVLARGNTLFPNVLLLGGPHKFIPALAAAWRRNIPPVWEERNFSVPPDADLNELIKVPDDANYFAAIGTIVYGMTEDEDVGIYRGTDDLKDFIEESKSHVSVGGSAGFFSLSKERDEFARNYSLGEHSPKKADIKRKIKGYIGIDGGSTSTKAVVLDEKGEILAKAYRLSGGNPLEDTKGVVRELKYKVESSGFSLDVRGVGTTGYAKDMLKEALQADVALVETVAHTQSALKFFDDVDVICDVGGQDIKVILLKEGRVKDFKLNTQCSAGNGYFLQSTARQFGYQVHEYADAAFSAVKIPTFNYGCAVFLESDIVNFQQQGWRREEILAGLAMVLPKNIWLYVVQEPNLKKLGKTFVLQGGTQKNLAAVKAQHDYILSKVPDGRILVHPHTGESGAIGAALEVMGESSSFIGFDALETLSFSSLRDESTRCHFCPNDCMRTFIDLKCDNEDSRRYIIAPCEKGSVEEKGDMISLNRKLESIKKKNPDLSSFAFREAFRKKRVESSDQSLLKKKLVEKREKIRVGIPRVLNIYSMAPFFIAYLESIGIDSSNIIFSDSIDEEMFKEGSRRGSIDQCFPSKASLPHVHNLIYHKNVNMIFLPIIIDLPTSLEGTVDRLACPTVQATPEVCKAAFTRDSDVFAERGIDYVEPVLKMGDRDLLERQMLDCFKKITGISKSENRMALEKGFSALQSFSLSQREKGREIIDMLENERRIGLVLIGRPYHNDPGLNHGIIEEIQKDGYPILTTDSLPLDEGILHRLFGEEVERKEIKSAMDISDVWKNSYSENSNKKIWGAKYVARHPNLVALDLSNFKCGHDSPIYSLIEDILHSSNTPYFTFHDIDENKPSGSIKIRVETINYFLKQYEDELKKRYALEDALEVRLKAYEAELSAA